MIIGVVGPARAGKSEIARILVEECGFTQLGFADQLKQLALAIDPIIFSYDDESKPGESFHPADARLSEVVGTFGYEISKDQYPEVRRFLQELGTQARNILGPGLWIDAWARALPIDQTLTRDINGVVIRTTTTMGDVVTPDVRFLNEAEAIKAFGGVLVRVTREGSGLLGSFAEHQSEVEQSKIVVDYTVENDGTIADLQRAVAAIVGDLSRAAA